MFKVGDKVKAAIYPVPVIGRVTKVLARCIILEYIEEPGRTICVLFTACTKLPDKGTVTYAETVH
jgi:hypothetical protein